MTNWEKYFSSPELAACMQVHCEPLELPLESQMLDGKWVVSLFDFDTYSDLDGPEVIAEIPCARDDPAALLEWMTAEADCGKAVGR